MVPMADVLGQKRHIFQYSLCRVVLMVLAPGLLANHLHNPFSTRSVESF